MSPHPFECGYPEAIGLTKSTWTLQCHRTRSSADTGRCHGGRWLDLLASMSPHPFECGYRRQPTVTPVS